MKLILLSLLLLFPLSTSSEDISDCDYLYFNLLIFRSNVLENTYLERIWHTPELKSILESTLGISIDDDSALKELSCKVVDAQTMADLAAILNIDVDVLRGIMFGLQDQSEFLKANLRPYKQDLRIIREWVKKSGFPDKWPLSVQASTTKKFLDGLQSNFSIHHIILYGPSSNRTNEELANILTASPDLNTYLKKIDRQYLTEDENQDILNDYLMLARVIKERDALLSLISGMRTLKQLLDIIIDLGLPNLA